MEQPSTSGAQSDQFLKNVFLLKNGDFEVINGQVHMPTNSEIATIRARTEQYKRGVEFNASMSSDMVKKKLEETFPYLKDKGFFCAAKRNVDDDTARFDFDGSPHQWNGRTIRTKIQGNSALYILETDQIETSTSGISASDSESSREATELLPWLREFLHFDVECNPNNSPLEGGGPCVFTFTPGLHFEVTSVFATFEELGTWKLERTSTGWLGFFPASPMPRMVTVKLKSQDDILLGKTQVTYVTNLQQVVSCRSHLKKFFEDFMSVNPSGNPSGNSGGETERFRTLGCKEPAQMLSLLVYVAAEIGAQQFIEIIFTSSAKRVVHNAYKRNLTLPETIARDHGYIETANYLADVTKRFSEETTTDNECSQTIDWSELVKAAEAAENQLDLTNEKQNGQVETNDPKETGYLADVDTSSSDASAPQSSDSEDDISNKTETTATATTTTRKERKGDDKDSGKQGDVAATDAQCVQYMTEENEQKSQSVSSSSRRFQAVENRETCNHVPCQTGGPMYYYYYNTCISASGFTAVGPGAQANNFHQPPARGVVHAYGHSPRHDSPRVKEQQEPTYNGTYMYDRAKPGWKSFSSENNSGTYCLPNISEACYQQKFGPKWNPKPSKGILTQQGVTDACSSTESFLKDVEKSMGEFDNADGPLKEEKEQFILLQLLPYLEVSWGKSPTKKMDAYRILAKISSSRSGGEVVKHALLQLQYLLFRDNLESCKENTLLKVEKIIRSTINSPNAVFKEEADSVREIRLSVYQRILCLIIVHQIQAGFPTVDFNNDLKKLREELKVCCNQDYYKRKNYFRYSMEFTEEAISYLLNLNNKGAASNLGGCLDQCEDILEKQDFDVMDLTFLRKLKKSRGFAKKMKPGEWFDMHCIMCYLHGKVHSECPKRQMCTERRAMILLRRILEAYQEKGGGNDWRFCLLAASILSDVAMNNVTKESRIEAASCLINLLKDEKLRKRPECRVIVERMSSEVVFSPDPSTKKLFANHLFENKNLPDALSEDLHIQRLTTRYRNQTLEVNKTTISQGQKCFVKRGMFQRKEVVVKILHVTKQDILEDESQDQSETRDRLVKEAYNLSRLRVQKHPHITVLLAYNTKSFPYHIITEFERYGSLLEFVRASREGNELLPTPLLLKMLLDVIEALMLLQSQGLVHRAVRAENVLVGDNYVCKLTGMHSLRQLQTESIHSGVQDQDSLYDYCSADDSCLDVISPDDENLPVRWKAPECLLEHRYSTASDVWAFGVLMYEVLTYGSHPYRNIPIDDQVISHVVDKGHVLPCELCFTSAEYDIMKRCWEWQRRKRTTFSELKEKLGELHDHGVNCEEIPRDDPPPLELHISNTPFSHSDNGADDLPKGYQGQDGRLVKERITGADKQHLKKLLTLNHPNLVKIWQIENLETRCPVVEMLSMDSPLGNLKEYVLDRRCQKEDIAMFLSQVASALHYLHVNHIVHGDLRAEYVNVLAPDKIEVARLARSKSLPKRADDVTSTSCAIPCPMPSDSTRWSSPEVILENNYSHASDVWAFGILAWELYSAFATGQEKGGYSLPYCDLAIDKILPHIRDKGPLTKPEGCPDWVYIIMHQCWTYDPVQRPPVIAIFDCLTSRQPMKSWMMSLWLENHEKIEWPDLSISQPEDASHVSIRDGDHFERTIKEMCSEGFFTVHGYKYVQWDATAERVPDEVYDDVERKDCTQNSSFVKDEELCEKTLTCQPRGGCNLRMPPRLPDSNTFSIDPGYKIVEETYDEIAGQNDGCLYVTKEVVELKDVPTECRYQNVQIDVTKTNLEEEELYDDVRGTTVIEDPKVFSTEPRHQNVRTDVIKTAVDMVTEVPCDFEVYDEISDEEPIEEDEYGLYEEIASQSPALCHSSSTDEHSKNFNSKSEYSYTAEDVGRETANSEDEDLYEEVAGAVISNSVEVCGLKSPGSSDESSEAIGCDEFTKTPEKSSVAAKGEAQNHDDPVYTEVGSLQVEDMRLNHKGGCQSTTGNQDTPGNPDTPGYRELLPREYTSLRKKQTSTLNPKDTSPKKNLTKLNNRRHRCYSEDTTENLFGVKEP